jgi:hypothetical protein
MTYSVTGFSHQATATGHKSQRAFKKKNARAAERQD